MIGGIREIPQDLPKVDEAWTVERRLEERTEQVAELFNERPAMTGEKSAPDHIVDANKMVGAPAEMPGVEEIRRIIDDALSSACPETWEVSAHAAQRLVALFAPILAEKQAHIDKLADLLIETQTKAMDAVAETEARALAAEAAVLAVAPYVDSIVCYASTVDEHDGNRVAKLVNEAAAAIRAQA